MAALAAARGAIVVVDYGMGNLRSVWQALAHVADGRQVLVSSDPAAVAAAERVVFPGQGAMPDCMHAVSYTHLDVYKRQDPGTGAAVRRRSSTLR